MKKFISMLLAASMAVGMAAVSYADLEINNGVVTVDPVAHRYSADDDRMIVDVIQYGKAAYYALLANADPAQSGDTGDYRLVSDSEMVDGMRVRVDYEQGQDLVAENGVSLVKKRITNVRNAATGAPYSSENVVKAFEQEGIGGEGYYYFIEMQTIAQERTSDDDIIATLEINKSKRGDATLPDGTELDYKVKDLEVDITTNVGYENSYLDSGSELMVENDVVGGDTYLEPEKYYLLKYDYDDEVEFTLGTEDAQNEGTFTVDVSGQGKNLLYFDTILDDGIAAANPDAKIYALRFNNTRFNRTGEFLYEAEDMEYAYELSSDGSLRLIGEFDGEEVTFRARVLGSYLFSDMELVAAPAGTVADDGSDATVAPIDTVTNPTTGGPIF